MFRGVTGIVVSVVAGLVLFAGAVLIAIHHAPKPLGFSGLQFTPLTPAAAARTPLLKRGGAEIAVVMDERTAEKAKAATLPLQMHPGPYQAALLIGQMRVLDLQGALAGARAAAENLENEAGAVEYLGAPSFFQIALLHRRERAIHHYDSGTVGFDESRDLFDLAGTQISGRPHRREHHNAAFGDIEVDGARKADGFIKPRGRIAFVGGSLVEKGGHNPFEAARLDCAILHGPDMANCAAMADALAAAGAALTVADGDGLASAVSRLLADPAERDARAQAAAQAAAAGSGAVEAVLARFAPWLDALAPRSVLPVPSARSEAAPVPLRRRRAAGGADARP